ncbi:MAG: hypothetical protein QW057_10405 [Candidatus Bathyarchaeia archaeon]
MPISEIEKRREAGLKGIDLAILKALLRKEEPMRAEELAQELKKSKIYIYTTISKRLTPKYTIKIGKRRFLVGLTEEGVKAAKGA